MTPGRRRKPVTSQRRAGRWVFAATIVLLLIVLTTGAVQAGLAGGLTFVTRDAGVGATPGGPDTPTPAAQPAKHAQPAVVHTPPAAPRTPAITAAARPVYAWVLTLQWSSNGMLTCSGRYAATSGFLLWMSAYASCLHSAGAKSAITMYWTYSKDTL